MSERSIPWMRARTITITRAMVNRVCAAMTEAYPRPSCGAALASPGQSAASSGLMASNAVTSATSVAMPITMPGMMMAM